jgi:hypothetical protein
MRPFRRLAASFGAGLVVSEMTAGAALAGGGRAARARMAWRRIEHHGAGPHLVQLAGCEARRMGQGARIAGDYYLVPALLLRLFLNLPDPKKPTNFECARRFRALEGSRIEILAFDGQSVMPRPLPRSVP